MAVDTEVKFTITLPYEMTKDNVSELISTLEGHEDIRGVITLKSIASRLHDKLVLVDKYVTKLNSTAAYINGVRTKGQRRGDTKRSLQSTAYKYYISLSTPMLRQQCTLFNVDFESYESIDDVVNALVAKHVEMASTN